MIFNSFQFPKWKAHLFKSAVRTKNLNRFKWNIIDFHLKSHQNMIIQLISISKKKKKHKCSSSFFLSLKQAIRFLFQIKSFFNKKHSSFYFFSSSFWKSFNSFQLFLISKKKKKAQLNQMNWKTFSTTTNWYFHFAITSKHGIQHFSISKNFKCSSLKKLNRLKWIQKLFNNNN